MSYGDFFIRYEHKFLRSIYSDSEVEESPQICVLQNYYVVIKNLSKSVCLLALLGGSYVTKDEDQFVIDLKYFLQEKYPKIDLEELRSKIDSVEIKSIIKSTTGKKIPRFNLKLYTFVYDAMIDFPQPNFMYDTIRSNNFLRNVHRLIKVKVHVHHSHITRKILGYAQDFCNWSVCENKSEIAMMVHHLFGFDIFFFIKGYRDTACGTKDLIFGGTPYKL